MSVLLITPNLGSLQNTRSMCWSCTRDTSWRRAGVRGLRAAGHPYTHRAHGSIPRLAAAGRAASPIEGMVPDLHHLPPGCRFADRCQLGVDACRRKPELAATDTGEHGGAVHPLARCRRDLGNGAGAGAGRGEITP